MLSSDVKETYFMHHRRAFKSEKLTESGNISISVQGVTSWHGIEETIKHMKGIHNVFIFFDADILGKHVLFMQSEKMIRKIQDEFPGLYIRYAFWSRKMAKVLMTVLLPVI